MDTKENEWYLDKHLADYIDNYTLQYVPDKDIKDILEKTPTPDNVKETLKLDKSMESFLREKGFSGGRALSQDKSLTRISSKVRDILGPLT